MKKTILLFTSIVLLLSCSNNRQTLSTQNEDAIPSEIVDTMSEKTMFNDISADTDDRLTLPSGYSKTKYKEYVPKDDIERQLFADLKEMTDATNKLDYKKVISYYYPDYFKYLQRQVPEKSIPEIKVKFERFLEQNLAERNKKIYSCLAKC